MGHLTTMSFVNFLCITLMFGIVAVRAAPHGTSEDSAREVEVNEILELLSDGNSSDSSGTTVVNIVNPPPLLPPYITTTTPPQPECNDYDYKYGDYCYSFIKQYTISFDDASTACIDKNASLTSVLSEEEHNFIVDRLRLDKNLGATFFIGALYHKDSEKWFWIHENTPFSYWPQFEFPPGVQPDLSIPRDWMGYDTDYAAFPLPLLYSFPSIADGYICKYKLGGEP